MISPQRLSVTNTGRKRRNDRLQQLRMMQGQATQDVLARKELERLSEAEATQQRQHAQNLQTQQRANQLTEEQMKAEEEAGRRSLGIQLGGMGMSALNKFGGSDNTSGTKSLPFVGDFNLGSSVGGGLTGAGVGQAFGGDDKKKRGLIGAGVGALTSWLSGGGVSGSIGGGILGGLGGLL